MRTGGTPMDWKLPSCLTCCRCFYSWETWGHRKRPIDRVDFPLKNMWNLANVAEELGDKYYAMLHCGKKTTWERTDSLGSAHGSRVTSSIPHVQTWFMCGEFEELPTQDYEQTHRMPPVLEDLEGKINMMSSLIHGNELYLCMWYCISWYIYIV